MARGAGERLESEMDELVVTQVLLAGETVAALHALELPDHQVRDVDVSVQVVLCGIGLQTLGVEAGKHFRFY